jgi:hypothetical protein
MAQIVDRLYILYLRAWLAVLTVLCCIFSERGGRREDDAD